MDARISATLAIGLALSAAAGGCTIHSYAGAAYPGPAFRSEPPRYQAPFHSDADRREHQQARADQADRDQADRDQAHRDRARHDQARHDQVARTAHEPSAPSKPRTSGTEQAQTRPRKADDSVALKPAKASTKRRRQRSFSERLGELVEQKKQAVARQKQARAERDARMTRALNAAADKQMND